MIKNTKEILAQTTIEVEEVLKQLIKNFINIDREEELNINNSEKIIGNSIKTIISLILKMTGSLLSNISEQDNLKCNICSRKLRINKIWYH